MTEPCCVLFTCRHSSPAWEANVSEPWVGGETDHMPTATRKRWWTRGANRHAVGGEAEGELPATVYPPPPSRSHITPSHCSSCKKSFSDKLLVAWCLYTHLYKPTCLCHLNDPKWNGFMHSLSSQHLNSYVTNSQYDQLPVGLIGQLEECCWGRAEAMGSRSLLNFFSGFLFATA